MTQADREFYLCYVLDRPCGPVLFVPHYSQPEVFVGPGGLRSSATTLVSRGARETKEALFIRAPVVSSGRELLNRWIYDRR